MSRDAAAVDGALLVRAQGIAKRFGTRAALSGVDLAVRRGEIVTLIGPNGAGKTTLLRILLGLDRPDSGTVERKPGLRVGYMPQRLTIDALLPLTVRRFLALAHTSRQGAIEAALAEVGAGHVIESPIQGISGGELRRVLLARALLRNPDLLVLDEPVQGVDVVGQDELFRLIFDIRHRRGCGILMVSHELHLVMAATDTVVCLNHHVCCTGRPEAVSRHPEYLALFGGAGERMLALYTHHHDHVHDAEGHVVHLNGPGDGHAHEAGPNRHAAGGGHG